MVNSSDITGIGPSITPATAVSGSATYRHRRAHTPKVEKASGGVSFTENSKVSALPFPQSHCTPPTMVDLEKGEKLISNSGCISCHQTDQKITGPAYIEIAKRYPPTEANIAALTAKIINGGAGNWGQMSMDPHPNLKEVDVREMVKYILSLNKKL
jgi:cytochrome c